MPDVAVPAVPASSRVMVLVACTQTDERADARLAGLVELYNVLTDAGTRLSVLTALLAFARDADLAQHLLPVIQVGVRDAVPRQS